MTFGTGGYGVTPYGGSSSGVSIDFAWPTSTRSVRVQMTGPVLALDAFGAGDALNPSTWTVTRLDSDAAFTILACRADAGGDAIDLDLLEELGAETVTHRIETATLKSAGGALIVAPRSTDFPGLAEANAAEPARVRRSRWRDLANPVRIDDTYARFVGTIQLTKGGDYSTEEDRAVVEKGVFRRVFTPRSGFRHLPRYGLGLAVKQPVPLGGDRLALEAECERQAMQEPDVVAATASYQVLGQGVVVLIIRGRTSSGISFTVGARRTPDGRFVQL